MIEGLAYHRPLELFLSGDEVPVKVKRHDELPARREQGDIQRSTSGFSDAVRA